MATVTPQQALQQIATLAQQGLAWTPPPPPPPPIDVASWWCPKTGKFVKSAFMRLLPDGRLAIYFVKNSAGWPMDIQLADSDGVYFRLTDTGTAAGWPPTGEPYNFRMYPQPNTGAPSLGFKISPRYYSPSQGRINVSNVPNVPTQWWAGCAQSSSNPTVTNLGPAASFISLVSQFPFGGSLGTQDTLICEYYYTVLASAPSGFKSREQFYLTANSGWVWWDHATWTGSEYVIDNTSHPNTFIPDTTQMPVMPCNVVL